jgi:hypothetical protein
MKAQHQNPNICQTCIYESECVHYQNCQIASKPIWFCANFDTMASLQVVENEEIYSEERSSQSSEPGIEAIAGRRKGLCINCDNRASCLFPIVEGGVWHCEEYC